MSRLYPENNTAVKRSLLLFLAVALLYGNARAADCDRFHLFGVRLGDSRAEVRATLGEPFSTTTDSFDYELDWFYPEIATRVFVRYDKKNVAIFLHIGFLEEEHAELLHATIARFGPPTLKPTSRTPRYYRPGLVWKSEECDIHIFSYDADLDKSPPRTLDIGRLSAKPMAVPSKQPTPKIQESTQEMTVQETAQPQDSNDKSDQEQTPAPGDEEDLTRKWGPEKQPDPIAAPLQFLYWRVDAMFERGDIDGDGRMDMDEFVGEADIFEQIDVNGDGFITKKELLDDVIPVLLGEGKIFIDG